MAGQVEGQRNRAGWGGAASGALDGPAGSGPHGCQQPGQGLVLGVALREPDVVAGHRAAMTFLERCGGAVDEFAGFCQLPLERRPVGFVGGEDRAGQAGVALVAGLQRRQQAPAVREQPVGAVEQVQDVVVLAGDRDLGAVGPELGGGQERLLGVFLAVRDVVHGHRRAGVPGIALQDVDRQAELGEAGQPGMTEPVGVAEPDRPSVAVGDLGDVAELAQHPVIGAGV